MHGAATGDGDVPVGSTRLSDRGNGSSAANYCRGWRVFGAIISTASEFKRGVSRDLGVRGLDVRAFQIGSRIKAMMW